MRNGPDTCRVLSVVHAILPSPMSHNLPGHTKVILSPVAVQVALLTFVEKSNLRHVVHQVGATRLCLLPHHFRILELFHQSQTVLSSQTPESVCCSTKQSGGCQQSHDGFVQISFTVFDLSFPDGPRPPGAFPFKGRLCHCVCDFGAEEDNCACMSTLIVSVAGTAGVSS